MRPSKLSLSKVTALRGGDVAFGDFSLIEKTDIIMCTGYAVQLCFNPKMFVEMNYEGEASDVSIAQTRYCGVAVAALAAMKFFITSNETTDKKKNNKLSAIIWAAFGVVTSTVFKGKIGIENMVKFNGALQALITGGYVQSGI